MFGLALVCAAWLGSIAVLLDAGGPALDPPVRAALVALLFVLLAGVPRPGRRTYGPAASATSGPTATARAAGPSDSIRAWRSAWIACALALGPLLVAAHFDRLAGRAWSELLTLLVAAPAAIGVLAFTAECARGATRHALAWSVLVIGLPLLAAVARLAPRPASLLPALDLLAQLSPATFCWTRARAARLAELPEILDKSSAGAGFDALPLVALLAGLGVLLLAVRRTREDTPEGTP